MTIEAEIKALCPEMFEARWPLADAQKTPCPIGFVPAWKMPRPENIINLYWTWMAHDATYPQGHASVCPLNAIGGSAGHVLTREGAEMAISILELHPGTEEEVRDLRYYIKHNVHLAGEIRVDLWLDHRPEWTRI